MRNLLVATKFGGCSSNSLFSCFTVQCVFFLSGFSFANTDNSWDSRGRDGLLYSSVPLPPALPTLIYKFATTITTAKKYFCLKAIYGGCPSALSVVSQDL